MMSRERSEPAPRNEITHLEPRQSNLPVRANPEVLSVHSPIAPGFVPVYRFWRSGFGEQFLGAGCADAVYGPTFVEASADGAFTRDCFGRTFSEQENPLPTSLVPGHNRDALYGRNYHPDFNALQ